MLIPKQEKANIRYNPVYRCFEVHIGITIVCRGSLRKCENYCGVNQVRINNLAEVHRMYNVHRMPEQEGFE